MLLVMDGAVGGEKVKASIGSVLTLSAEGDERRTSWYRSESVTVAGGAFGHSGGHSEEVPSRHEKADCCSSCGERQERHDAKGL